ncbi:microcystin dependent MdpB family protein [Capsulimonas corticalis]|uniref:Microcystin dependent MdpB family protein n=1 Tax=Capsulimonas corticalis TaxID=2219043 RepID=A0A402D0J0_9BACT|nr:tail fiber protein [Capsulimonas corticalis]BDI33578.1 microcystin dependent MdpB family protein [Capsulimonas corticalis]
MSDQYIGEIRIVPFGYAPYGWAMCNGQILPINTNSALFSLLGTYYGGDGISTFGLPNLIGRAAMAYGNGNNLTPRAIGEIDGSPAVELTPDQLGAHTHVMNGNNATASSSSPDGAVVAIPATGPREPNALYNPAPADTGIAAASLSLAGSSQAHDNMQPYLTLNFIIALNGAFPPRS